MSLDPEVQRLATGQNYATVVTLMPDGTPQAQITWVDADADHLLVNTTSARQRARNLRRDPRITVLIRSETDPYDFAEVRGTVVEFVGGDEAARHIDVLARKYDGHDFTGSRDDRVILRISPSRQISHRQGISPRAASPEDGD
jgi:PPOX class probable F420-dependent enzyme